MSARLRKEQGSQGWGDVLEDQEYISLSYVHWCTIFKVDSSSSQIFYKSRVLIQAIPNSTSSQQDFSHNKRYEQIFQDMQGEHFKIK